MTNINCSEKCVYQKDGKCSLENIIEQKINSYSSCAYFTKESLKFSDKSENDYKN